MGRLLGAARPLEIADTHWHVEFLPDLDGELTSEQDIIVQSDLILPQAPELGGGERTRRVTTVGGASRTTRREETFQVTPPAMSAPLARLAYTDDRGPHTYVIVRDATTIGRGGTMFPGGRARINHR